MALSQTQSPPQAKPQPRPEADTVRRWLVALLVLGFALRLAYGLTRDTLAPYADRGGDSAWYLANGYTLVTDQQPPDIVVDLSSVGIPPGYMLLTGFWQALLSPAAAIIAIRITQALLGVATCYFGYRLARALTGDSRAGLLALGVLAVSPAFILEASNVSTETLYIFFITAGLTAYVELMSQPDENKPYTRLTLAAALIGCATLTRAVLLLFPVGLALHLLLAYGWREGLKRAAWLLLVYALTVSTWTVYNLARWNRFIIAGEGLSAFFYVGAAGWSTPTQVDEQLGVDAATDVPADDAARQGVYVDGATNVISRDIPGYLRRRVTELTGAYLQPHGTVSFPGASLREMAAQWWRDDRSAGGLLALARGDGFWPKLSLYVFHFVGLLAGLVGMWQYRRRWRVALPMIGFILYTTLVHLFLLALPRYLFPTELFWWVFAAAAISRQFSLFGNQTKAVVLPEV
jgi:4-amino-4-deoxy-L-arabinose transferase-like glycosyltransferase